MVLVEVLAARWCVRSAFLLKFPMLSDFTIVEI